MPNWTSNTVTITGDEETLKTILAECVTDGVLDFEKVIPFPTGFDRSLPAA